MWCINNQGLLSFFKPSLRPQTLLLRSLLLLPVLLVIWYSLAEVMARPAIELSGWLLTWALPTLIQSVGVNDFYMVSPRSVQIPSKHYPQALRFTGFLSLRPALPVFTTNSGECASIRLWLAFVYSAHKATPES